MSNWDDGWNSISWIDINKLEDRIETLEEMAHPPLGQDQIYDKLEELEARIRKLEREKNT